MNHHQMLGFKEALFQTQLLMSFCLNRCVVWVGRYGLLRLRFNDDVKAPSSIFPVAWSKIQPRCFLKCQ